MTGFVVQGHMYLMFTTQMRYITMTFPGHSFKITW